MTLVYTEEDLSMLKAEVYEQYRVIHVTILFEDSYVKEISVSVDHTDKYIHYSIKIQHDYRGFANYSQVTLELKYQVRNMVKECRYYIDMWYSNTDKIIDSLLNIIEEMISR